MSQGAERLHLVDLDGAKAGKPVNVQAVRAILSKVNVPCQLGGGVRDEATIKTWLDAGIDRVIVGTRAIQDPAWFRLMAQGVPDRLVLGLDAKEGLVATDGWLKSSTIEAITLGECFDDLPLAALVYTDIARDGMLTGPNVEMTGKLARSLRTPVIASGGVGSLEDLRLLAGLPIAGCIVGRSLYENCFGLAEAIAMVRDLSRPPAV